MEKAQTRRIEVSSDAATRIAIARDWMEKYPADAEIVVVAHSVEAATDLQLALVANRGAWFGVKRFTLNFLAARLAQHALARSATAPASNLSFTAVTARAIHSLQEEGKLSYFEPVATRPGFPVAVTSTLQELRMNEVDPELVAQLERGGRDLAAIASLVEQELKESKLSDRAALFRAAIDSIKSPENAVYLGRPLLLLDVAVRSRLETAFISELAARSPNVLATAPFGDEQTIELLEGSLGCKRKNRQGDGETREQGEGETRGHGDTETRGQGDGETSGNKADSFAAAKWCPPVSPSPCPRVPVSLAFAKQHLFADSAPAFNPLDQSLRINSWPGEPRECVEIVRSIQAEAAQGVPFDQMAVLLNSPGEYRSHLEEAFSRAEIPAYFAQGSTSPDPAGRAMLALLSCAAEGLSARGFAEYLSLGQVPETADKSLESAWVGPADELLASLTVDPADSIEPAESPLVADPEDSAVIEGSLRAPARWERLLVDSAVIGGKHRWTRRLQGLANELLLRIEDAAPEEEAKVESIRKQLSDLESLRSYALPLLERLANLPDGANWGEWLVHLRELTLTALRYPNGVLATLADLEPMDRVGPVDLHEVQLVLGPRLHDLGVKPPPRRYGSVFVGSSDSARGLSFRVVFIPGLAERIFPRKIVDDPVLPDKQRQETAIAGLATRRERLELERLALRIALGSARERVYLSYPRIDVQQSRPRVPSFYALEALRAAEGDLPGFDEIAARAESTTRARLGWPAPERPEDAIDEAEYDLALLAGLVGATNEDVTGRAHYLLTANNHLARALRGRSRRWLRRWTPNDGLVDPDELGRQSLANHQFSARSFSATALQNYSSCPYRFFLSAILRLEMRQEPAAIEVIDPLTRGSMFHETQFEVLTALKAAGMLPLVPTSLRGRPLDKEERQALDREEGRPGAFDLVDEALDRLAKHYEDRLAPAIPRVWQDGINSIRADLREWLRRMAHSDDGWVPDKFELSFGLTADRGPRDADPDSVSHPVEIIGDFKLRGSIDLVERHSSGKFRVTDHKTGKARATKDTVVGGGKSLQPLLYALAAKKLLNQRVESGRLYYCTADGGYEDRVVPFDEYNLQMVTSVLTMIRQSLADAFLPAAPEKGACGWCDFLAVCGGFEETRTRNKPGDRLVQLKGIRELP